MRVLEYNVMYYSQRPKTLHVQCKIDSDEHAKTVRIYCRSVTNRHNFKSKSIRVSELYVLYLAYTLKT